MTYAPEFQKQLLMQLFTLSSRSEFDLDYDSYQEDYYDRYCQQIISLLEHQRL